ncbi:HXXXD-type acyl-transferase family protein [Actinidia rufa]|uniref:HXXXD-type acyl-transferase family protein n=1 Tax=Actinidia rufa TaxID=165716 RepID=A0A7J0FWC2_9ERIC|nr:HXXXD-type acyl-transferase family protein [Actinidia rufa]
MEVKISKTTTVHPSSPPFHQAHVLPLSHLDTDRNLDVSFRYLRVYVSSPNRPPVAADPFHVITAALSAALVPYYPLAGTLRRRAVDGHLELHCAAGDGVPVVLAAVDCSLESVNYLDDPAQNWIENLVPDPDPEQRLENPLILQVTMFACGGYTLGAAVTHPMCDGLGATQFFNGMAELARGASRVSVKPVWDRAMLLGPRDPPRVEFPVQGFLKLDKGFFPYSESGEPVVRQCFDVKDEWLDRLKGFLREHSGSSFTTFEALGAFIWRARVKATGTPDHEEVKFAYPINMRKLVNPPLPPGYWGNGCTPIYVQLIAKDLINQPIWETAELIKKSKRNGTDEYVRSFIDFQELNYAQGINAGKGVSGFTDWRHLGHSSVDFGWGGPVTVLPLSRHLFGGVEPCFFLPYSSASGGSKDGFKLLVHLQESAVPGFRAAMEKFSRQEFDFC